MENVTLSEQQSEIQARIEEIKTALNASDLNEVDRIDLIDELNGLGVSTRSTVDGAKVKVAGGVTKEENESIGRLYEKQTPEQTAAAQEASINAEVARIEKELNEGEDTLDVQTLTKLGQKPSDGTGDFVFTLKGEHGTGTDAVFAHVHKDWVKKCISMEKGMEILIEQQSQIEDFRCSLKAIKPVVTADGKLGLEFPNGRVYTPTEVAINGLAIVDGPATFSTWQLNDLINDKEHATKFDDDTGKKVVRYKRDAGDAQTAVNLLMGTAFRSDRTNMEKTRLFRTWKDGTLRAVLSEQYAIVNNVWVMETIREIIPNGLLSHWRGDGDNIYGNVLIPDTIREDKDSKYGGMLSVGNSEIGSRRVSTLPSVFRSICMNGCIWGGEDGKGVKKRHRGEINLKDLKKMIQDNLQAQIPLLKDGVDMLLEARKYNTGVLEVKWVIAEVAKMLKLSKPQATKLFEEWAVEKDILGQNEAKTLFGIINAVTRLSQVVGKESPDLWVKFDTFAGNMLNSGKEGWEKIVGRASKLTLDDLEDVFAVV